MIKPEMSIASASLNRCRALAAAFAYPEDEARKLEYDRLFRASEIWLYGAEHYAKNEFDRVNILADIMGFYRAFGVEPNGDRADLLSTELEFVACLIYKRLRAKTAGQKAVCQSAERKFIGEHLYPAAVGVAKKVLASDVVGHYRSAAQALLKFAREERKRQ